MPTYYVKTNQLHFAVYDKEVVFYTSPKVFDTYAKFILSISNSTSTIRVKIENVNAKCVEIFVKSVYAIYGENDD